MNALELADYVDAREISNPHLKEAATMLRQQQAEILAGKIMIKGYSKTIDEQQAEIEALRKSHIELERGIVKDLNQRQSAEPVAYVNSMCNDYIDWKIEPMTIDGQSLYTHPVKEQDESFDRTASHMSGEYVSYQKELTDEEIRHIQAQCHLKDVGYDGFIMRFARAILRKASEK